MAFCSNCGADKGAAAFCSNCGQGSGVSAPPPPSFAANTVAATNQSTNGFAIASFVLSLLCGSLLAVIFGHIALSQINKRGGGGRGFAIAGLIIGYISMGIFLIMILAVAGSSSGGY
jgi:hypothetical protein